MNRQAKSNRRSARRADPHFEALEGRQLLTCNLISGRVYEDLNLNGILDVGEPPIANSRIQLKDSTGKVVGSTQTDASGFYQFDRDETLFGTAQTVTRTLTFDQAVTDWTRSGTVPQFDADLGTLTSVEIINNGTLLSNIQGESRDSSAKVLTASTSATLTLTGTGLGSPLVITPSSTRIFNASPFDGVVDFGGTSGVDFGEISSSDSKPVTLTDATLLALFVGSGTVDFTESVVSNTTVTGPGNVAQSVSTTAGANISVIYHYTSAGCLAPGSYTVEQVAQPEGFTDGQESQIGVVLPNSAGTDFIPITLGDADSVRNDFGEVRIVPPPPPLSSLAGFVYYDGNNNGLRDAGEYGIANVKVSLTGTDRSGRPVSLTTTTADDGSYRFGDLQPGDYQLVETQPRPFRDGKDRVGTQGGQTGNDRFLSISLPAGVNGTDNNFGERARPGCRLPGLVGFHTLQGNRLPASAIGARLRFYLPTLIPRITRRARG